MNQDLVDPDDDTVSPDSCIFLGETVRVGSAWA